MTYGRQTRRRKAGNLQKHNEEVFHSWASVSSTASTCASVADASTNQADFHMHFKTPDQSLIGELPADLVEAYQWHLSQLGGMLPYCPEMAYAGCDEQFLAQQMPMCPSLLPPWPMWDPTWSLPPGLDVSDEETAPQAPSPRVLGELPEPMKVDDVQIASPDDFSETTGKEDEEDRPEWAKQVTLPLEPLDLKLRREEVNGRTRIIWPVDAKLLRGREGSRKQIVSPPFEVDFRQGVETMRIMLVAKQVHQEKGGGGFRKSRGRGSIELKCSAETASKVKIWTSVGGDGFMYGPTTHNFQVGSICRLPKEWNFWAFVRENTFSVAIFLQPLQPGKR